MPPHLRKVYDQVSGPRPTIARKPRDHLFRAEHDQRRSYSSMDGRELRFTFRDSDYKSDGVRSTARRIEEGVNGERRSISEEVVMRDSLTSERDERRNFEPVHVIKNVSDVALLFDTVRLFWANEHTPDPRIVKCDPYI